MKTIEIRIALQQVARTVGHIVRVRHVLSDIPLHEVYHVVCIIELEQDFLMRHLRLQIDVLLYVVHGLSVRQDELHRHADDEKQCC